MQSLWMVAASLFFALMGATAYMTVRSLGQIGEPEWRTVLLFSTTSFIGRDGCGDFGAG
ncbi:MAG: hypothetical protein ACRCV6_06285 [Formosimonas sp.]